MGELEDIEREEQELIAQLAAKRIAKEALIKENERLLALTQPVTVTIVKFTGNQVLMRNDPFREDILEVFRNTEGRAWQPINKLNAIPVGIHKEVLGKLSELSKVTITYAEGVEAQIHDFLNAPDYSVDVEERWLTIKTSRKAYTYELKQLPGYSYNYNREIHRIPLTEGWRLHDFSTKQAGFVWSDKAKEFVLLQVENRLRLDEIAKAEDVELEIPLLKASLKPFQRIGIKFFETNGGRGILGDEMGTGKTLQMIGLLVHNEWKAVVVCPATLKENWLREIKKFAPHLTTYTCQGVAPQKYDIVQLITKRPDIIIINYDILGRSIEEKKITYKNDKDEEITEAEYNTQGFGCRKIEEEKTRYPWVEVLNLVNPDICIMDEGHYIKNLESNRSRAARKMEMKRNISLTGTPILNRPGELWPLLHIADPVTFPAFDTFETQYTTGRGGVVRNVDQLKQLLRPLMIRRLKRDVLPQLEPINRQNHYFELSEKGRKLYDKVLAGIFEVLSAWNPNEAGSDRSIPNMLVQIQRLKQVVAYDAVESTADLATEILDATPEEATEKNKVLVFSQFKATTYAISRRLGSEALSFVSLSSSKEFVTAQQQEQQALIDRFQTDPSINFLCVTEKTAKEGHNITAAKAVIFNDLFWTPAGHQQAEARAYGRISDLHTIDAYYRIGINSISEKIMELLAAKLAIIEQVVEGVEASRADTSIIHELLTSLKEEMWTLKKKK